jgi:hypothetical protein
MEDVTEFIANHEVVTFEKTYKLIRKTNMNLAI